MCLVYHVAVQGQLPVPEIVQLGSQLMFLTLGNGSSNHPLAMFADWYLNVSSSILNGAGTMV